ADRAQHDTRLPHIEQQSRKRHRHLAYRRLQPARGMRDRLRTLEHRAPPQSGTGGRRIMKVSQLTGRDNYFEDFEAGQVFRHARGKTVEALENVLITNLVMNTAQAHFNEHVMQFSPLKQRISYGGVTFSLVMGLASQDTCENALAELGLDNIRLLTPVVHGDTLYAYSEVLTAEPAE